VNAAPADLRAAALSDLRTHACGTTWSMLDILLPDVPGAPYGGTATPEQRQATAEATDSVVQPQARPAHLRALLRAWAAAQPSPHARQEQALRWLAGPCEKDATPGARCWDLNQRLRFPDAEYLAYRWCEPCTAAYGLGEGPAYPPPRPGTDNATGLRSTIQTLQGLTEDGEPDLLARLQASLTRVRPRPDDARQEDPQQ
jgi:hypothetical protein